MYLDLTTAHEARSQGVGGRGVNGAIGFYTRRRERKEVVDTAVRQKSIPCAGLSVIETQDAAPTAASPPPQYLLS